MAVVAAGLVVALSAPPGVASAGVVATTIGVATGGAGTPTSIAASPPGTIVAVAGSLGGTAGNSGDGGAATAATLHFPQGIAVDTAGNLYIADYYNNRVRKVRADGTIVNFAGSAAGTEGFSGDGGPATAALMISPQGVAVDATGNVYVSERHGNRVRKVNPAGVITTFAGSARGLVGNTGDGGPATAATLEWPAGLAVDQAGDVFIADEVNNQIRKVDVNGIISNFAGSNATQGNSGDGGPATKAQLSYPTAVAVDAAGNVYIADARNHRVRVVNGAGTITNFAGATNYTMGNTGDGGPAGDALLENPDGVAVDRAGNVYIADQQSNRVRRVDPAGTITHFAGSPYYLTGNSGDGGPATAAVMTGPDNLAVDAAGDVYIEDVTESRIRAVLGPLPYPEFTAATPPTTAAVGRGYSYRFVATGVPGPTFALADGELPDGLTLDATSGIRSGIASSPGRFSFSISAANGVGPPATSAPVTITVSTGAAAPAFSSPATATFADALAGSARITTTGYPTPVLAEVGALPNGVRFTDNHDGTATIDGPAAVGQGGVYRLMIVAANGVGSNPSQTFSLTVNEAPAVTESAATFTVGAPATAPITTRGFPIPAVTETGTLPAGISFDGSSRSLRGAAAQGTVGTYALTVTATNTSGPAATQDFTVTVNQAVFTVPFDGESIVTVSQPFRWSTIPQAQGYIVVVGTSRHATNLANSGILAPSASAVAMPAFPPGPTLYATLLTKINGAWTSYQDITFVTSPYGARFTYPADGQIQADPTRPILWQRIDEADAYWLVVGTRPRGTDLLNSGPLAPATYGYQAPILPPGKTIYATLLTEVNGRWSLYDSISYTAHSEGGFTHPLNGQLNVANPTTLIWTPVAATQLQFVAIGTTYGSADIAYSGYLSPDQLSYDVGLLPAGKVLYATLVTFVNGNEAYQIVAFTASGTSPAAAPAGAASQVRANAPPHLVAPPGLFPPARAMAGR